MILHDNKLSQDNFLMENLEKDISKRKLIIFPEWIQISFKYLLLFSHILIIVEVNLIVFTFIYLVYLVYISYYLINISYCVSF